MNFCVIMSSYRKLVMKGRNEKMKEKVDDVAQLKKGETSRARKLRCWNIYNFRFKNSADSIVE
jgi:hypothetical protein